MNSAYVRGLAYLQAKQPAEAKPIPKNPRPPRIGRRHNISSALPPRPRPRRRPRQRHRQSPHRLPRFLRHLERRRPRRPHPPPSQIRIRQTPIARYPVPAIASQIAGFRCNTSTQIWIPTAVPQALRAIRVFPAPRCDTHHQLLHLPIALHFSKIPSRNLYR